MRDWIGLILCVGLVWGMAGCRSQSKTLPAAPEIAVPEAFSMPGSEVLPDKWWQSLRDPALDGLIEEALAGNFSLQTSWDRLAQAEQVAVKAGAPLLPSVRYQASATRTRREPGVPEEYATSISAGLVASYEVDLWRRVRAGREATLLDVESRKQDLAAAAVTLSASVAKTWYQLAESKLQVSLIGEQLNRNQQVLGLVIANFSAAKVGASDVLRQRQLVESSRGQLIQAQEQVNLLQNRLCVLIGRVPDQAWTDQTMTLINLPVLPATGVPADRIGRRPDVASAFHAIRAADQRTAVAIADKYPSLSLTGTLTTSDRRIEDLLDDWVASLAGSVAGPLFDAGLRKAEVKRTQAVLSQAIHTYQQAVIVAIQEVEDALVQETHQRAYLANLAVQLDLAKKTYERTYYRYSKGQGEYLRVLDSLTSQQQLERSQLSAKRSLIDRRVDLCRALAGDWDMDRPDMAGLARGRE
ncbi:MAG: efflux transporter outer membrane subunit [Phycisphaerae bacterium]|nr:efflux transporter outer membrane subunit [Phycisphaerae bacterium]